MVKVSVTMPASGTGIPYCAITRIQGIEGRERMGRIWLK